ncbi:kinase-like domain-containing protein [Mycena pura]|uniref:Kinase-like domain-containing protein n=1 Tax=Mycena pura TaxID=153505 RepID=A0AAD6UT69_9AGAR|nr:kinase-like domain-containing protein [Mycena pura]
MSHLFFHLHQQRRAIIRTTRGSSWLSVFSDARSDESSIGSPFRVSPSPQRKWNIPSSDLHSHEALFKELDLTGQVTILDRYPFESGSIADIYRGILNIYPTSIGSPRLSCGDRTTFREVAVKIFRRMHAEPEALERASRSLYEEARIWRCLEHPNILPFLGISLDLGFSPALLSPLCVSGPIMKYLQHNTKTREEKLQMVIGVANGLAYLHSEGIVHGNLCTKKILVDGVGLPVICGYAMSKPTLGQQANPTSLLHSPIRFTCPESFAVNGNGSSLRTTSADVYAFSMVTLEIMSGLAPYHHLPSEHDVFMRVLRGERPVRTHLDPQVFTDRLWQLLTSMWDQKPYSRPDIPGVAESLTEIWSSTSDIEMGDDTQPFDSEAEFIRSPKEDPALVHIHRLDLKGRVIQDDQYPFAGGANANIYRGKLTRANGRRIRVALKMIRMSSDGSGQLEDMLRRLHREVDVWSRLGHKNLLPFIGVCEDLAPLPLLISPFYKFGHIGTYLKKHPNPDRQKLAYGVASGLQFLHENQIIHGDLKVQNVLVDKKGNPCICDFGISKIVDPGRRGSMTSSVGTPQYMAPELFLVVDREDQKQIPPPPRTTKNSDIYSFGLLVLEILTSEPPKGRPSQPVVMVHTVDNLRPKRWEYDCQMVSDEMWSILDQCWSFEPCLRPTIADILQSPPFNGAGPPPRDDPRPLRGSEHLPITSSSSQHEQGFSTTPSAQGNADEAFRYTRHREDLYSTSFNTTGFTVSQGGVQRTPHRRRDLSPYPLPGPLTSQGRDTDREWIEHQHGESSSSASHDNAVFDLAGLRWTDWVHQRGESSSSLDFQLSHLARSNSLLGGGLADALGDQPQAGTLPQDTSSKEKQDAKKFRAVGSPAGRRAAKNRRKDQTIPGAFVCEICGADFTAKHNLRNHMNSHGSVKEFRCDMCGQSFGTSHVLKRHEGKCLTTTFLQGSF